MSKKIQVLLLTSSMLIVAFVLIGSLGVHASGSSSSGDVTLKHIGVYSEVLYRVRAAHGGEPNMSAVSMPKLVQKENAKKFGKRYNRWKRAAQKKLALNLRKNLKAKEKEGVAGANLFGGKGATAPLRAQKYKRFTYTADPQKKI